MVKVKYEAKDGTQFDTREEAQDLDNDNFQIWLETSPVIDVGSFLQHLPDQRQTEMYDTEREIAKSLLRGYWDNCIPS